MIGLCVALPRAGVLMPGLNLPLPFGFLFIHLAFWPWLFLGSWPSGLALRRVFWAFAIFASIVAVSGLLGYLRGAEPAWIAVEMATLLGQIPAFFLTVWWIRDTRDLSFAMTWLALCVIAISAYGIAQFYLGPSLLIPGITYTARTERSMSFIMGSIAERRVLSSYGDPNVFAGVLVQFIPGLMGLLLAGRVRRRWPWLQGLALAAIGAGSGALVYCDSRAGYLGLAGDVILMALAFPWKMLRWIILGCLALACMSSKIDMLTRSGRLFSISDDDPRLEYLQAGLEIISEHPEGSGLGVNAEADLSMSYIRLKPISSVWNAYNSSHLHILSRTGIAGFSSFVFVCLLCVRRTWRSSRRPKVPWPCRTVATGLIVGCLGVQVSMMVNPYYQLPGGGVNFWLSMGLAYTASRMVRVRPVKRSMARGWRAP